jgi:serine/threonine protein kinase
MNSPSSNTNSNLPSSKEEMEFIGDYKIGKVLGQGSFGKVRLGKHILSDKKVSFVFQQTSYIFRWLSK